MKIDNSPQARAERKRRAQAKVLEGMIQGLEAGSEIVAFTEIKFYNQITWTGFTAGVYIRKCST